MAMRRRPPSPGPGNTRMPLLDADERRIAASKGLPPGRTKQPAYPPGGIHMTSGEWKLLFGIVLVACGVRLFRISFPTSVVFDEVHFGKFAGRYIKTKYFVDVHPPLAKLLITLVSFVFGYDGHFDFKDIGKEYDQVPYVAMRLLPALLGVATVPLSYVTLRALDCKAPTALLASLFLTFENALITQSRLILLDSPLVFFTALTIFFWVGFCNEDKHQPFTDTWWAWLALSGLSLGAVLSSKWVGLFTVATVGLSTIRQLWLLLGDTRVPIRVWIHHFIARALCLIVLPIFFYMSIFSIHFAILNTSGEGDGFMSSEFQQTLRGKGMADTFADVAVGSTITIRHLDTQGGYLHSHSSAYPGGSKQQQITLYPHKDGNNDWMITNTTGDANVQTDFDWANHPLIYITTGMRVKLFHLKTERRLHSHDYRPPVSEVDFQNEVSGYGMAGFVGDLNDDWVVEIYKGNRADPESFKRLRTLTSVFRLRHALTGCYLFSHKVKLPDWGFEQQEVTCNKQATKVNSLWYVETSKHVNFPENAEKVNYRIPGFFSKFWELQKVMWRTNAGLTDRHTFDSRPQDWPWLRRGINFWVKDHRQIYLLGNPLVWWLSSFSVLSYVCVRGFMILRAQRGYRDFENTKIVKYENLCSFLLMGWALHYFPFYLMARQLFLHHYLPALYFSILLLAACFDFLTSTLRPRLRLQLTLVFVIAAILVYSKFNPLVYGSKWTKGKCTSAKWVKTWDFSCHEFYETYEQYDNAATAATPAKPASTTIQDGARGPIVVQEGNQQQQAQEDSTTSVALGAAKPGHDVFGDQEGIKVEVSRSRGPIRQEPEEKQEGDQLSWTIVNQGTSSSLSPAPPPPPPPQQPPVENQDKVESKPEVSIMPVEAGPKDEAQVEAEKVAQELYPSAAGGLD